MRGEEERTITDAAIEYAELVQRTADGEAAAIENVRVNHGGFHIFMPQQFLNRPNIIAGLKQSRCKTMAKSMASDRFLYPRQARGALHGFLQTAFIHMMTAD